MVPRSESVKIFELQSSLAQKCAAIVEMEEAMEAKAATIESFKAAVAAVCPLLPPTQPNGNRKTASKPASAPQGSQRAEHVTSRKLDMNKRHSRDQSQFRSKPSPAPQSKALRSCQLNPEARPFVPRQPCHTRARARRNCRQRNNCRHVIAHASTTCPVGNAKQRRAEGRKIKQLAWQAAQAEPAKHGEVSRNQAAIRIQAAARSRMDRTAAVIGTASALNNAAESALAASRDRRNARREAEVSSRAWCGPVPTSIFDVPTPPRSFIDGWYSSHTPRMGGSDIVFGKRPLTGLFHFGCKPLDRRKRWTYDRKAIDYGDDSFIANISNKEHVSALGQFF